MSWHPNDLLTDADLLAYEKDIIARFAVSDWETRRNKAMEDWLWPQLRQAGFNPARFRTRHTPDVVWGLTSSVYTDKTSAATNTTSDDLALATILAASSDALVIGSTQQFRGVSLRLLDTVSATASVLTVELWRDAWQAVPPIQNDITVGGVPFARGGSVVWNVPPDWVIRPLSTTTAYYYARLRVSAAPAGATAGQVSVIQRSILAAPLTYRVLAMIFREAPMQQDGPWAEKASFYETEASLSLARALTMVGGEFDADGTTDDTLDREDEAQTAAAAGSPFRWERA